MSDILNESKRETIRKFFERTHSGKEGEENFLQQLSEMTRDQQFHKLLWMSEILRRMQLLDSLLHDLGEESLDIDLEKFLNMGPQADPEPCLGLSITLTKCDIEKSVESLEKPLSGKERRKLLWVLRPFIGREKVPLELLYELVEKFQKGFKKEFSSISGISLLSFCQQFVRVLEGLEFPESPKLGAEIFRVLAHAKGVSFDQELKKQLELKGLGHLTIEYNQ